jgi:hypothetical protein
MRAVFRIIGLLILLKFGISYINLEFHSGKRTLWRKNVSTKSRCASKKLCSIAATAVPQASPESPINANMRIDKLKRKLDREFLTIGLPAFVSLAAEPLASLVDSMYVPPSFLRFNLSQPATSYIL